MTQATQPMNFLPEDYVEKRQQARTAVICVGLLVVVLGGVVAAWMFKREKSQPILDELSKVNAEFAAASTQIAEAKQIDDEKSRMMEKAELTTLLMEKVRRSTLLDDLTRLQPKGVHLIGLELKSKDLPVAQLSEAEIIRRKNENIPMDPPKPPEVDVTIDVTGTAETDGQMTQYVAALNKSTLLSDVNMIASEETKSGTGVNVRTFRQFHVQMKINRQIDLRQVASAAPVDAAAQ